MDNVNMYTREYKLNAIGLTKYGDHLSNFAIDLIFNDKLAEEQPDEKPINKEEIILLLLNSVLSEMGKNEINDIAKFKVESSELKKIEGKRFVDDNIELFEKIGLTRDNLQYNFSLTRKKYIVTVLRTLVKLSGYDIVSFRSSRNKTSIMKYKTDKI